MTPVPRKDCCDCADVDRLLLFRIAGLTLLASMHPRRATPRRALIWAVERYRATPRPVRCRRKGPSCSAYMLLQLEQHGLRVGLQRGMTYIRDHALMPADVERMAGRMTMGAPSDAVPISCRTATVPVALGLLLAALLPRSSNCGAYARVGGATCDDYIFCGTD